MKSMLTLLAGVALLAAPAAQVQGRTIPFHPIGTWTADYGDDYCRLIRTFSDGQSELSLALERIQPGPMVRVIVIGEGVRPFRGADQIGYTFNPVGGSGGAGYARSVMADGRPFISFDPIMLTQPAAVTRASLPSGYDRADEQEAAKAITEFTLDTGLVAPVQIDTGSLRAPIEALQVCADTLLTTWGLDVEKYKGMSLPPIMNPNPEGVLPQHSALFRELLRFRNFGGGTNQVQLLVAADGSVADCAIYSPSVSRSANELICRLARERASFAPAKDADGQPMASLWAGSLWDLGPPPSRAPFYSVAVGSPTGPRLGLTPPPSDAPTVTLIVPPNAFPSAM
ncbi:MAG: hypothetical protein J7493_09670 [Porphyrobacter sp.]|nr:hypothetical protein [Porphyrobacter sp.]